MKVKLVKYKTTQIFNVFLSQKCVGNTENNLYHYKQQIKYNKSDYQYV